MSCTDSALYNNQYSVVCSCSMRSHIMDGARLLALILISALLMSAFAQADNKETSEFTNLIEFGGPSSAEAQIEIDNQEKTAPFRYEGFTDLLQPYFNWKDSVSKEHGLNLAGDYNFHYQAANKSQGEDDAAGGIIRLYGRWQPVPRGSLVFKIENRHKYTDIAPQQLSSEIGYAGLTSVVFSDAGTILTNLYWQHTTQDNQLAFVAGILDVTDYVAVYGLVSPWTNFINLAFSTDPTISVPNQGVGAAVRVMLFKNMYLLGGFADANGDPSDPGGIFDSFLDDREYFKHLEFGWTSSYENRFADNVHITIWHSDERDAAMVTSGKGVALSYSQMFDDRWLPFARFGYSNGGGSFLERSVSIGLGYFPETRSDTLGIGLNWGLPSEETFGSGLDAQYTSEVYYRFQLFQHVTITPNLQYLKNPALNPAEDSLWIVGLRARLVF